MLPKLAASGDVPDDHHSVVSHLPLKYFWLNSTKSFLYLRFNSLSGIHSPSQAGTAPGCSGNCSKFGFFLSLAFNFFEISAHLLGTAFSSGKQPVNGLRFHGIDEGQLVLYFLDRFPLKASFDLAVDQPFKVDRGRVEHVLRFHDSFSFFIVVPTHVESHSTPPPGPST